MCRGNDRQSSRHHPYGWSLCWRSSYNTIFLSDHQLQWNSLQNDSYGAGWTFHEYILYISVPLTLTISTTSHSQLPFECRIMTYSRGYLQSIQYTRYWMHDYNLESVGWNNCLLHDTVNCSVSFYPKHTISTVCKYLLIVTDVCSCSDPAGSTSNGFLYRIHQYLHPYKHTHTWIRSKEHVLYLFCSNKTLVHFGFSWQVPSYTPHQSLT